MAERLRLPTTTLVLEPPAPSLGGEGNSGSLAVGSGRGIMMQHVTHPRFRHYGLRPQCPPPSVDVLSSFLSTVAQRWDEFEDEIETEHSVRFGPQRRIFYRIHLGLGVRHETLEKYNFQSFVPNQTIEHLEAIGLSGYPKTSRVRLEGRCADGYHREFVVEGEGDGSTYKTGCHYRIHVIRPYSNVDFELTKWHSRSESHDQGAAAMLRDYYHAAVRSGDGECTFSTSIASFLQFQTMRLNHVTEYRLPSLSSGHGDAKVVVCRGLRRVTHDLRSLTFRREGSDDAMLCYVEFPRSVAGDAYQKRQMLHQTFSMVQGFSHTTELPPPYKAVDPSCPYSSFVVQAENVPHALLQRVGLPEALHRDMPSYCFTYAYVGEGLRIALSSLTPAQCGDFLSRMGPYFSRSRDPQGSPGGRRKSADNNKHYALEIAVGKAFFGKNVNDAKFLSSTKQLSSLRDSCRHLMAPIVRNGCRVYVRPLGWVVVLSDDTVFLDHGQHLVEANLVRPNCALDCSVRLAQQEEMFLETELQVVVDAVKAFLEQYRQNVNEACRHYCGVTFDTFQFVTFEEYQLTSAGDAGSISYVIRHRADAVWAHQHGVVRKVDPPEYSATLAIRNAAAVVDQCYAQGSASPLLSLLNDTILPAMSRHISPPTAPERGSNAILFFFLTSQINGPHTSQL